MPMDWLAITNSKIRFNFIISYKNGNDLKYVQMNYLHNHQPSTSARHHHREQTIFFASATIEKEDKFY